MAVFSTKCAFPGYPSGTNQAQASWQFTHEIRGDGGEDKVVVNFCGTPFVRNLSTISAMVMIRPDA